MYIIFDGVAIPIEKRVAISIAPNFNVLIIIFLDSDRKESAA